MVPTEKHFAFKLEDTARYFGSDRHTPRIHIGKYRQGFWFLPKHASHLACLILPEISVLAAKAPRIQIGKYRQKFWFCPKNASHANWKKPPGISVLTKQHLAFKLVIIAKNFGAVREIPLGISALTEKRLAFKLRRTAGNFGSDRQILCI